MLADKLELHGLDNELFSQDELLSILHDIRTPIAGTNRMIDLIAEGALGPLNEPITSALTQIRSSNDELLLMVEQLMDSYEHIEYSDLKQPRTFDLNELIEECIADVASWFSQRRIKFKVILKSTDTMVSGSRGAIKRVLINLLTNAAKFTSDRITVRCSMAQHVAVEISDNGDGLTSNARDTLFRPFTQTESGRKLGGGRGLGLYLCKRIVEAHGGEIACYNNAKKGCTFSFRLPATTPATARIAPDSEKSA